MSTPANRTTPARLIVCADDFGLNRAVDRGIVELAAAGRLSAVSCMSQGAPQAADVAALTALPVDLGLHLNFTDPLAAAALHLPLPALLAAAYARLLPGERLTRSIEAQLDAFERQYGRAPDYVDGHQHVHQLPQIRDRLLAALRRRYSGRMPWLRSTLPPAADAEAFPCRDKAALIARLGAAPLLRAGAAAGCARNGRLLGVYGFDRDAAGYLALLERWLALAADGDLLMCHPAAAMQADDVIAAQRVREFGVLGGPAFAAALAAAGVVVARFAACFDGRGDAASGAVPGLA